MDNIENVNTEQVYLVVRNRNKQRKCFSAASTGIWSCLGFVFDPERKLWWLSLTNDSTHILTKDDINHIKWLINISKREYENYLVMQTYKGIYPHKLEKINELNDDYISI